MQEMIKDEDRSKRNTPPPSSSSRRPSDDHEHGYDPGYKSADVQEKQDEGNQEKPPPLDAAQETAKSLLRVRQAAVDIRLMTHYTRRLYDPAVHLVPTLSTPDLYANIVRVDERRLVIE
jgi:hypothetical protein